MVITIITVGLPPLVERNEAVARRSDFESAKNTPEEIKNPAKNIAKAKVAAVALERDESEVAGMTIKIKIIIMGATTANSDSLSKLPRVPHLMISIDSKLKVA